MQKSQSGFFQLLLIIFLLIGIGVGVYLVQFTQIFKPKASETNPTSAPFGSDRLSDTFIYPKPSNHVQTVSYIAYTGNSQTQDIYQFGAKEFDLWIQGGDGSNNFVQTLLAPGAKFKALNPNVKYGTGIVTSLIYANVLPWPAITSEADILHKTDGSPAIYMNNNPAFRFLNIANPQVADKFADYIAGLANQYQLDALVFDTWHPEFYDQIITHPCQEGPCDTKPFWQQAIANYTLKIKTRVPNLDIYTVGIPEDLNNLIFIDGVYDEHPEPILTDTNYFKKWLQNVTVLTQRGRKFFMTAEPRFICSDNWACADDMVPILDMPNTKRPIDLDLQRFFLASYLLIQNNPLTYFGYHPGVIHNATDRTYFYKDWNKDYGTAPAGYGPVPGATDMFYRRYTNGDAVVNASTQAQNWTMLPGNWREWDPNGPVLTGTIVIPPKTGKFFFAPHTFTGTASPSPSLSPAKPGDTDGDNDVDIFDYNTVVTDFGKTNDPNTKADLDNDNDVDIFDYNIVVGNFGK